MNKDQVEGSWKQFIGAVRERWGHLTGDDAGVFAGIRERLEGSIQERRGYEAISAHHGSQAEITKRWKVLNAQVDRAFGDLRAVLETSARRDVSNGPPMRSAVRDR